WSSSVGAYRLDSGSTVTLRVGTAPDYPVARLGAVRRDDDARRVATTDTLIRDEALAYSSWCYTEQLAHVTHTARARHAALRASSIRHVCPHSRKREPWRFLCVPADLAGLLAVLRCEHTRKQPRPGVGWPGPVLPKGVGTIPTPASLSG